MKRFLGKAAGLSRSRMTRLTGDRAKTGRIVDRCGGFGIDLTETGRGRGDSGRGPRLVPC